MAKLTASDLQPVDELQFGTPPSLLTGTLTGLIGAGAGVISLLLYFQFRQPESYISHHWLIFILAGAAVGTFLRLERPFYEAYYRAKTGRPFYR